MNRRLISVCIALALLAAPLAATAKEARKPHTLRGSVELESRSNDNISLAPSSSSDSFDYADFGDFAAAEDEEGQADEEEEEDDGDSLDEDIDAGSYDEDELEEDDAFDEDGDGIDDLIDPNVDSSEDSERRNALKFGLQHKFQAPGSAMTWGSSLKVVGDWHQDRDELDKVNYALGTGPEWTLPDERFKIKLAASYVSLEQNSKDFLSTFVGTFGVDFQATRQLGFDLVYNYQDKDVTNPDSPDAVINTLTFGAEWKASKSDIFKARYSPKVEDSSRVSKNKDTSGWQLTYTRKLPWDFLLGFGIKNDSVDYKNLVPHREDDIRGYGVDLEKKLSNNWTCSASWEKRDRDSNIDSKDGANRSLVLSVAYKF